MAPVLVAERPTAQKKSKKWKKLPSTTEDEPAEVFPEDVDMEKDDTEEELERLVFGDSIGFREGIKSFAQESALVAGSEEEEESPDEEAQDELQNVADADVCLVLSQRGHCG